MDASGAAIPDAAVKVTNTATGLVRTVNSGADGTYVVPDLPVGPYRMDVTKEGFAAFAQTGIVLQVATNPTINLTVVYQTPRFANTWQRRLLSDWKFAGIYHAMSAYWVTPILSTDIALNGDLGTERPVQVLPNPLCANPGPNCWINPAAFATPAPGTISPLNRNNVPGPSYFGIDTDLSREFRFRERHTITFRAEAFNVTNSFRAGISLPSLAAGASGLNLTFGTPTFGQITSAQDPRILQMAMIYAF